MGVVVCEHELFKKIFAAKMNFEKETPKKLQGVHVDQQQNLSLKKMYQC